MGNAGIIFEVVKAVLLYTSCFTALCNIQVLSLFLFYLLFCTLCFLYLWVLHWVHEYPEVIAKGNTAVVSYTTKHSNLCSAVPREKLFARFLIQDRPGWAQLVSPSVWSCTSPPLPSSAGCGFVACWSGAASPCWWDLGKRKKKNQPGKAEPVAVLALQYNCLCEVEDIYFHLLLKLPACSLAASVCSNSMRSISYSFLTCASVSSSWNTSVRTFLCRATSSFCAQRRWELESKTLKLNTNTDADGHAPPCAPAVEASPSWSCWAERGSHLTELWGSETRCRAPRTVTADSGSLTSLSPIPLLDSVAQPSRDKRRPQLFSVRFQ